MIIAYEYDNHLSINDKKMGLLDSDESPKYPKLSARLAPRCENFISFPEYPHKAVYHVYIYGYFCETLVYYFLCKYKSCDGFEFSATTSATIPSGVAAMNCQGWCTPVKMISHAKSLETKHVSVFLFQ